MTDEKFIEIVNNCGTMVFAAKTTGMAYSTFIRKAKKLGCYNPNQGSKGEKKPKKNGLGKIPLKEILEGRQPQYQTYKLKRRLIEEHILEDKCSICGWDKKPEGSDFSPCELDHIDGNPTNHELENLRILCPNCHSLTETYRFRRGKTNGIEHQDTKVLE